MGAFVVKNLIIAMILVTSSYSQISKNYFKLYLPCDTATFYRLSSNIATIDSLRLRRAINDSEYTPVERGQKVFRDSCNFEVAIKAVRGYLTTATIDSQRVRRAINDSEFTPVERGIKTFRDSCNFEVALKVLRAYLTKATIDSMHFHKFTTNELSDTSSGLLYYSGAMKNLAVWQGAKFAALGGELGLYIPYLQSGNISIRNTLSSTGLEFGNGCTISSRDNLLLAYLNKIIGAHGANDSIYGFEYGDIDVLRTDSVPGVLRIGTNAIIGLPLSSNYALNVASSSGNLAIFTKDMSTDVSLGINADNDGAFIDVGGIRRFRIFTGGLDRFQFDSTGNFTAGGVVNGAMFNSGQGNYELYAMDQNVRTTDTIRAVQLIARDTLSVSNSTNGILKIFSYLFNGLKSFKINFESLDWFDIGKTAGGRLESYLSGDFYFPSGSFGINTSSMNAGYRAHVGSSLEVDSNLKVKKNSLISGYQKVTGPCSTSANIYADSIVNAKLGYKINSGDLISVWDTGSYPCTVLVNETRYGVMTNRIVYSILNNQAVVFIPQIAITLSSPGTVSIKIPSKLQPQLVNVDICKVVEGTTGEVAQMETAGDILITTLSNGQFAAGDFTFRPKTITVTLNNNQVN